MYTLQLTQKTIYTETGAVLDLDHVNTHTALKHHQDLR